jgi:hypothetical protein
MVRKKGASPHHDLCWTFDLTIEDMIIVGYPYALANVFRKGVPKSFEDGFTLETSMVMSP